MKARLDQEVMAQYTYIYSITSVTILKRYGHSAVQMVGTYEIEAMPVHTQEVPDRAESEGILEVHLGHECSGANGLAHSNGAVHSPVLQGETKGVDEVINAWTKGDRQVDDQVPISILFRD